MVSDLLLPSGGWNGSLIKSYFYQEDAEAIFRIPLSSSRHMDSLFLDGESIWMEDVPPCVFLLMLEECSSPL
ncbi:hypothetical protein ACOSQ2_022514 [Xanthoceras sorbifolium]